MTKRILTSVILLLIVAFSYAQIDTVFWFVAPEISSANAYDNPIYLRISAYSSPANVSITLPANSSFTEITRSISANQTVTVDLSSFKDSVENKPANTVINRGILIRSNVPISVYYEAANSVNTDIFVLKGKQALGNEFYIPSQNQLGNNSTYVPAATSAFDIVAIEPNTVVTITPKQNIVGHTAGTPFNVTLNKGQTYSATASSQAAAGHLIGSKVTSTKPIAITIKDDLLSSFPCSDIQGDQIVPTSVIGTDYVVVKGSLNFDDGVYIVASKNNTSIYLNGNATPITTLSAGGYYYYALSAAVVNIHASEPVYVYHNTGAGCEIGGALLPGITCTGSNSVSVVRTTNESFYVNIVTTSSAKNSFLVNGSSGIISGSAFSAVPGSSTLVYAHIDLSSNLTVGSTNRISNSSGSFHLGVIHGGAATGTRYGYFSGYSSLYLGPDFIICQGDKMKLDAGEGRTSYLWSTGDTTRSIYVSNAGTYWVRTVQTSCVLYDTIVVTTKPKPNVSFNITSDTIQCFNKNNFTFKNTSSISSGTMTYLWRFGDGKTSTAIDANHTYSVNSLAGGYPVSLIATSIEGCMDSVTKHVYTRPVPAVDFLINDTDQCLSVNRFIFTDNTSFPSSTHGGIISGYLYRFGDSTKSTLKNPIHTYQYAKTQKVTLVVSTSVNCRDSLTRMVTVYPSPDAKFDINDSLQCLSANSFRFESKTTMNPGTISSLDWNFGDTTTATGTPVIHVYKNALNYKVKLTATANNGCYDSIIKTAYVVPVPIPFFICNDTTQCVNGNNFMFTSLTPPSVGDKYLWDFGDGTTSTGLAVSHTYTTVGIKNVKMVITRGNCRDSIIKKVYVLVPPDASFTTDSTLHCLKDNLFKFTNTTTYGGTDTLRYKWLFGDGMVVNNVKDTSHPYALTGKYTVWMYATSKDGCVDSASQVVNVHPNPKSFFLIASDTSQCILTNSFNFQNSSTGGKPGGILWAFGDGITSTLLNPSHSYTTSGTFTIDLTITNTYGCTDKYSRKVLVRPIPEASYTVNDSTQCLAGNVFNFTNTSKVIGMRTYRWNFGDSARSTLKDPTHTYTKSDTYTVRLIVITPGGCIDTTYGTTILFPAPGSKFSVDDTVKCQNLGRTFQFKNLTPVPAPPTKFSYFWTFGDPPASSTLIDPSYTYLSSGIYNVSLKAGLQVVVAPKDTIWCYDTAYLNVIAAPAARVIFKNYDSIQCFDRNLFHFTNQTKVSFGTLNYLWNFGDGDTSTSFHTTHHYNTIDTFLVTLKAISNYGCSDSFKWHTYLKNGARPVAAFTVNDTSQCITGNNFVFTNTSTISAGSITSQIWSFGDGDTSHKYNVSHVYKTDGIMDSKLFVVSDAGCFDSVIHKMLVAPKPKAGFVPNDSTQCFNENMFNYNNTTSISLGTFKSLWNFGDGDTSTIKSPKHSFKQIKSYIVKLVAESDLGCKDSVTHTSLLYPFPVASFIITTDTAQCLNGNKFSYSDKSTMTGGTIVANLWRFGDGNSAMNDPAPSNSYSTTGTYTVSLVVASDKICYDTATMNVSVYNGPFVDFTVNDSTQCLGANNFVFTNNSSITGDTLTYLWKFGDGNTSALINPSHSYTYQDTFNVKLIARSSHGCNDSFTHNMAVVNQFKTDFTINDSDQCINNNVFIFTNTTTPVQPGLNYYWNFGNGDTSTTENPTYTYSLPGTYNVTMKILSSQGCSDSVIKKVYIFTPQQTSFTVTDTLQCLSGNSFIFTNTSVPLGSLTYLWDFGNNQTSTLTNPSFSFTSDGTHAVKLTSFSAGCTDSFIKNVYILPAQKTSFTVNDTSQCLTGNVFNFTNTSSFPSGTLTYLWDFGNGNTSTSANISYSYTLTGKYTVKLLSNSSIGCRDSAVQDVYVGTAPKADYSVNTVSQCLKGNNFQFTNSSTAGTGTVISGYLWDFGDGGTSNAVSPSYIYLKADTFYVKLKAITSGGCDDSITKEVYVRPMPKADFSINTNPQSLFGNKFMFTNTSSVLYGSYTSAWNFGDGNTAVTTDASNSYSAVDTYAVQLRVTSSYGCTDTITKLAYVISGPPPGLKVDFSVQNACAGDQVLFINTSTVSQDSFMNFFWDFGDGTQAIIRSNPKHIYLSTGTYLVKLRGVTWGGMQDSISQNITIYDKPNLSLTYDPDTIGFIGQKITLTANGIFSTVLWSTGEQTASIVVDKTGNYVVTVTNINNCSASDSVYIEFKEIETLDVVTIFTPNGDGYNDYFKILNFDLFKPMQVSIYNRWGDELFSANNYSNDWDGRYKGKTLPEGAYYYIIIDKTGKVHKGAVSIMFD